MSRAYLARLLTLAGLAAAWSAPAAASPYFALATTGGAVNPGIYVGFNPQPDPPGTPPTTISFDIATSPLLTYIPPGPCEPGSCSAGDNFGFVMSFTGIGNPTLNPPPDPEIVLDEVNTLFQASRTSFDFNVGDHVFSVTIELFGPSAVENWSSFNPQPDPPGDGFGYQFNFAAAGDPGVTFNITEDGHQLSFQSATPIPAALPLFGTGLGVLGLLARRRKRSAARAP